MTSSPSSDDVSPQRSRGRMILHASIAIAIVMGAMIGVNALFSTAPTVAQRKRPPRRATLVEVSSATPSDTKLEFRASGLSMPSQTLNIVPQVSGRIATLADEFAPGSLVAKGTVLATIEAADYHLAVRRAQSSVAQAQANLALESGSQELAKLESEFLEDLVTDKNRELVLRGPQLATANAALQAARVELQQARLNLSRTKIVAPFDALVLSRQAAVGGLVGSQASIATLASVDEWWIRAELPVDELVQVQVGDPVQISLPSVWGEKSRTGTVSQVGRQVEEQGRLGTILVSVSDPLAQRDATLPAMLSNLRFDVVVTGKTLPGAITLDPTWVHGENKVWVMNAERKLEQRTVAVALRNTKEVIVTGGLAPGENIITSRLASPVPGMSLRLADDAAAPNGAKDGPSGAATSGAATSEAPKPKGAGDSR